MKPIIRNFLFLVIPLAIILSGCGNGQDRPSARLSEDIDPEAQTFLDQYSFVAGFTDNPDYGIMAIHENGEAMIVLTNSQNGEVRDVAGAILYSPEGEAIVVYIGPNGLPDKVILNDYILLFSNYGDDSMDIAIVAPDGSVELLSDVPVDPALISAGKSSA